LPEGDAAQALLGTRHARPEKSARNTRPPSAGGLIVVPLFNESAASPLHQLVAAAKALKSRGSPSRRLCG
jgi:hypothetical protein